MLIQQFLSKQKEKLLYTVENLTTQPLYWCIFRKKVVVLGQAPVERLTEPTLIQPGESARVSKPEIKLPWKRYIVFAQDPALLGPNIKQSEFDALLNIWVDELGTVVLTEFIAEDGVRAVKVSSWAAWAAKKKMAPTMGKVTAAHEAFLSDMHGKLIAGMEPHLHAKQVARVRSGRELCSEEQQFLAMRGRVVRDALHKVTGLDLSATNELDVPRIQICASGGGYRAMIATLGSMIGMESTGLLDCVTSIAGLSGSTWAMTAWMSNDKTLQETRALLAQKLQADFYTKKLWPDTVKNHIKERIGYDQEVGLVDVMAWHLHNHLMLDLPCQPERWNHPRLSEQAARIADGSRPLPIYTAVAHEHKRYRWFEFTPFEVGVAQDINAWIPSWAFGRKFSQGISTDFAVEPSLSLLQAVWGSAFCATVDQMCHELEAADGKEPAFQRLLHTLIYDKLEMSEDRLITPAKFPNYAFSNSQLQDHPWQHMKSLKLMDAGVHTNLPFPPLLRPERETDIIIALDQSSAPDIFSSISLDIVEKWVKDENLAFPECKDALELLPSSNERMKFSKANEKRCTIVKGNVAKGIPTIIYLPLLKNDSYSASFCPRTNALTKGGYCSTFNFKYTSDQVNELAGLTESNMKDSYDEIAACIAEVTRERIEYNKTKPSRLAQATSSSSSYATSQPREDRLP